jgi:hypothetical protein
MVKNKSIDNIVPECVFCKRNERSKEHLWPRWIDKYCKDTYSSYTIERLAESRPMTVPGFVSNLERPSIKLDRTSRLRVKPSSRWTNVVCKKCNNGWMSRVEAKAEKALGPVFSGDCGRIDAQDIEAVCAWIALRVMMMEFEDPDSKATKDFEHDCIYQSHLAPPHWKFWIGVNKEHLPRRKRQSYAYIPAMEDYQAKMDSLPFSQNFPLIGEPNTRFTNIQIGNIVLLSYSSTALWEFPIELPFAPYFKRLDHSEGETVFLPILQTPPILAREFAWMTIKSIWKHLRR